jgi:hypothetical protein
MSNDSDIFARLYKQQASIGKLVLDGARDPYLVAEALQSIIDLPKVEPKKFAQMTNGRGEPVEFTILVPADYDHSKALARFAKADKKKCYYFNPDISDKNFSNPSRVLKAGDRLRMQAFEQIVPGTTTSDERLDFQRALPGNVFVGAQGLPFIFKMRAELPKGKWYSSFDEKERLPVLEGYHRVPHVNAYSDGVFGAFLGDFEKVWYQDRAFFCFSDESLVA